MGITYGFDLDYPSLTIVHGAYGSEVAAIDELVDGSFILEWKDIDHDTRNFAGLAEAKAWIESHDWMFMNDE